MLKKYARYFSRNYTARMIGATMILLFVTIAVIGSIVYIQGTRSLTESVYERLHAVATLKEDSLRQWVDRQRLDLAFITWQTEIQTQAGNLLNKDGDPIARQSAYAALSEYLTYVVTSVSETDELIILDLSGNIILSTQPQNEGESMAGAPFFLKGLSTTSVQPVYSSSLTGKPTITVSTPLFDLNKKRVGVIAGHLNLARIDRIILERTGLGYSGETYLVNASHEFVSSLRSPDWSTGKNSFRIESDAIEAALSGRGGAGLYENYNQVPVIGVYSWLDDIGVALLAELGQDEAFAPVRALAQNIIILGLLGGFLLAGVGIFLGKWFTRPVLAIAETASLVAAGDLDQVAPVMTDDEVGYLAQSFNQMTGQLKVNYANLENKVLERTADLHLANQQLEAEIKEREIVEDRLRGQNDYLAALHDTTLGIISRLDLQDLLDTIVSRAGQLLHTPHGYIYIVEADQGVIECKIGTGMFKDLVGFRLPRGQGLGGTIWETGESLLIDNYDEWEGRATGLDFDLIRSIVGIPLQTGGQVVGVLGLAYDHHSLPRRTFGEREVELLSRFAHLASLALDNARMYSNVREAREIAERANESKSVFLANVSHELRTPLTSILGFARIVQKRLHEKIVPFLPPESPAVQRTIFQTEENLNIVVQESERLTTLINDLLDLEKIRVGKMTWRFQPVDVSAILHRAVVSTAPLLESKGLTLETQFQPDLPEVNGDPDRLVQVGINLISNAIKFTDQGAIYISAEHMDGSIRVRIRDQGIGISPEDLDLVFEKFVQVGETLTNKPRGTGLGLPISKEIVEVHGGRIWVESLPGVGSTFSFTLPVIPRPGEPKIKQGDTSRVDSLE